MPPPYPSNCMTQESYTKKKHLSDVRVRDSAVWSKLLKTSRMRGPHTRNHDNVTIRAANYGGTQIGGRRDVISKSASSWIR